MKDWYCFIFMCKYCWHHLCNVLFGAVIKKRCASLVELLLEDLEEINYSLRVMTEIGNLLHTIEKYFGETAKYAKVKGSMFMYYMFRCHPTAYLYPVYQSCVVSRQDISIEGAVDVLMSIPHYLDFLIWGMRCRGDGILEKNVYRFAIS